MEERTRLGRGLEEVSRLFLSGRPRDEAGADRAPGARREGRRALRVFHPDSPLVKSLFVANFALELARGRNPVSLWDGTGGEASDSVSLLEGVISRDLAPEAPVVRLYGLPDILVYGPFTHPEDKLGELAHEAAAPEGKGYLLMSLADTVESIRRSGGPFDAVMLCPLDAGSLLKVFAFIKVIRESDPESRIFTVFDDPPSEARAREVFTRLDGFTREKLQCPLTFLGAFFHDEALERSVGERVPVVLARGASASRDSLTAVSEAFLREAGQGVCGP